MRVKTFRVEVGGAMVSTCCPLLQASQKRSPGPGQSNTQHEQSKSAIQGRLDHTLPKFPYLLLRAGS